MFDSEKHLEVSSSKMLAEEVAYFTFGDKTVFLVQIDIFPHEESASKRPIPESETMSELELQAEIDLK